MPVALIVLTCLVLYAALKRFADKFLWPEDPQEKAARFLTGKYHVHISGDEMKKYDFDAFVRDYRLATAWYSPEEVYKLLTDKLEGYLLPEQAGTGCVG